MFPQVSNIPPVLRQQNRIDRTVCHVDGRPLVLFHKRGISLVEDDYSSCPALLRSLGAGPVIELQDDNWAWCNADAREFNCHAMAIGSGVGLSPNYWLEGRASDSTLFENPAQVMLDYFYQGLNRQIQDNDIFVLFDSATQTLVHSGFLRRIDGINFAVSKFGEGPVCLTSFELLSSVYQGRFDQVYWYRRNKVPDLLKTHPWANSCIDQLDKHEAGKVERESMLTVPHFLRSRRSACSSAE